MNTSVNAQNADVTRTSNNDKFSEGSKLIATTHLREVINIYYFIESNQRRDKE